jgi:surfeit locus 1 family protein
MTICLSKGRTNLMSARARIFLSLGFLIIAAVCARLGAWQAHRLRERRAANAVALAARSAPVLSLGSSRPEADPVGRRVQARGRYDHPHDIVLRGREYAGVPGVEIVSPLLLDDSAGAVLVNRGFVPTPDAVTVYPDSLREPGEHWVEGIALPIGSGGGGVLRRRDQTTWGRLDLAALRERLPYPIGPFYIQQSPDTALPRFPRRLDPPVLDDGPHLSYAIQWFAFAIIALVFAGIVLRKNSVSGTSRSVNGEREFTKF